MNVCFRHRIVRIIAPKLYFQAQEYPTLRSHLLSLTTIVPRPAILHLAERHRTGLVGAEIGVDEGINAESILQTLSVKTLYLIDPYLDFEEAGLHYHPLPARAVAVKRLEKYGDRAAFIDANSHKASGQFWDSLDFAYIDASHTYENVRQDVADWWPDVKVDGLLCGHDFSAAYPGVIRAISEFAVRERYQLNVENGDWWIEK